MSTNVNIRLALDRVNMGLLAQNQTNAPRLYTPGEVVTAHQGFMKGHGTYVEGDDIKVKFS